MVSPKSKGFCDLNVLASGKEIPKDVAAKAFKLGYKTIAINQVVVDDKSKSMKQVAPFPAPHEWNVSQKEADKMCNGKGIPTVLSRITIKVSSSDSPFIHRNKANIRKFDLIALQPTSEEAFKQICLSNMDIDIISFDVLKLPKLSPKLLKLAIAKDIYFELCYSPCMKDSLVRDKTIQLGHYFNQHCKYPHLILSSGTSNPSDLRGPYDVANMSLLFGMTAPAGKASVCYSCWDVVHCANARKSGTSKCSASANIDSNSDRKRKFDALTT